MAIEPIREFTLYPQDPLLASLVVPRTHETRLGEITAHRMWVVDQPTGLLRSVSKPDVWPRGTPVQASCASRNSGRTDAVLEPPGHAAPGKRCDCGIYGLKTPVLDPIEADLVGKVRLWGHILEYSGGYRAEFGRPAELTVLEDGAADGETFAYERMRSLRSYGVPLRRLAYWEADDLLAMELRQWWRDPRDEQASDVAAQVRALADGGDRHRAIDLALAEVRRRDIGDLDVPGWMYPRLPGPLLLHTRTDRRYVSQVEGEPGKQTVHLTTVKGAPPIYYGPQYVSLDTTTGEIVEKLSGCVGPRHRGHHQGWRRADGDEVLVIRRFSPSLVLETWLQLLWWHAELREEVRRSRKAVSFGAPDLASLAAADPEIGS